MQVADQMISGSNKPGFRPASPPVCCDYHRTAAPHRSRPTCASRGRSISEATSWHSNLNMSEDMKRDWPELFGQDGEAAKATIEKEMKAGGYNAPIVEIREAMSDDPDVPVPVPLFYQPHLVWAFCNPDTKKFVKAHRFG
eukprot:TRINITY_DN391_c0_g1_i2.p1 TRINITY_DN391_c0_g1~~TRINITY_DN391_c0_g1_i2.p1  ORF type:complete len:140 (-),score=13.78 TRINITY_DN391_c0_g1_i2:272-691(-)